MNPPVLIAGAGPTGLVLALWLTRAGVPVRIVDASPGPGTTSRAMVVHARTLELYRALGIDAAVIDGGVKFTGANLWVHGEKRSRVPLGDIGKGLSPYPYILVFPQDAHERLLVAELEEHGLKVERNVRLASFTDTAEGISATLQLADGRTETCEARYLAGCDGAHSVVREAVGGGFPGGTYPNMYYVADVEATGPVMNGELNVDLDKSDFIAIFPMKGEGRARFVGQVTTTKDAKDLHWHDVRSAAIGTLNIDVKKVNWFSAYRVHHRVSGHFRRGRAFLLGDAGHIHSPVGGQGMNTGIGDAINLGWKLAEILQGRAPESLLDSYEQERLAFAKKLVRTTDFVFRFASSPGRFAAFIRTQLVPKIVPAAMALARIRRAAYRTISQTGIQYRNCEFNDGAAGSVRGGDRLPWAEDLDNYAPLASRQWQAHVYGENEENALRDLVSEVSVFPFTPGAKNAGLSRNAIYLVRPDGYVAFAGRDASHLKTYLDRRGLKLSAKR